MKSLAYYLIGFAGGVLLCFVLLCAALESISREADNRAAAQLRNDRRLMLKVPYVMKRYPGMQECVLDDGGMECPYSVKGEQRKVVVQ